MNSHHEMSLTDRTTSNLNTANSWGFAVVLFALLADIIGRSILYGEAVWDLFAIIFLGGGVSIAYAVHLRGWRNVMTRKSMAVAAIRESSPRLSPLLWPSGGEAHVGIGPYTHPSASGELQSPPSSPRSACLSALMVELIGCHVPRYGDSL